MKKPSKNIKFKEIDDTQDGRLLVIDENIPFQIKRVYFIDKVSVNSLRGFHAHKKLFQLIFCINGSFDLEIYDGKKSETIKVMREPYLIAPKIWHMMRNFTEDCLICVLASDVYQESDYIRNFHHFKKLFV